MADLLGGGDAPTSLLPDGGMKSPLATRSVEPGSDSPRSSDSQTVGHRTPGSVDVRRRRGERTRSRARKSLLRVTASVTSRSRSAAEKPTGFSIKSLGAATGRAGVALALKPIGGRRAERLISRFGYRRLGLIIVVSTATVALITLGILIAAAEIVISTVTKPVAIAESIVDRILGGNSGDTAELTGSPRLCAQPPNPGPMVIRDATRPREPETSSPKSSPGSPTPAAVETTFTPPPPMDTHGHLTPDTVRLMNMIPRNTDPVRAEAWLLFSMAHPPDDPRAEWDRFGPIFSSARAAVGARSAAQSGSSPALSDDPLAVLAYIDSRPDYLPFLLPAASITASLIYDGKLSASKPVEEAVLARMMAACKPPS